MKKWKGHFYISPAKRKRLASRICRVKCKVTISHKLKGYASQLKLDSAGDPIGFTRKSLDKFMKNIMPNKKDYWYSIEKWSINPY